MERPDAAALIAVAIVACELARIDNIDRVLSRNPYGGRGSPLIIDPKVQSIIDRQVIAQSMLRKSS